MEKATSLLIFSNLPKTCTKKRIFKCEVSLYEQMAYIMYNYTIIFYPQLWERNVQDRVSRKLRPQTRKSQTLWVSRKLRPEKLRPSGCLEISDPKTQTLWMSRKVRPEKYTYLHRVALRALVIKKKEKQLAVLDTCNDHENYTQHSYRFFFSLSYKFISTTCRVIRSHSRGVLRDGFLYKYRTGVTRQ